MCLLTLYAFQHFASYSIKGFSEVSFWAFLCYVISVLDIKIGVTSSHANQSSLILRSCLSYSVAVKKGRFLGQAIRFLKCIVGLWIEKKEGHEPKRWLFDATGITQTTS